MRCKQSHCKVPTVDWILLTFTERTVRNQPLSWAGWNDHQSLCVDSYQLAYHGSNSWMMLSNRITAKSLELNPARQARKRMLNESKDCHPAGCVSPPDRPPLPPPPPAAPGRLFPCTEPPELLNALCLPSLETWCSAISARGVGWICSRVPSGTLRCLPPLRTRENSCSLQPLSYTSHLLWVLRMYECFNSAPLLLKTADASRNVHSCATSR